MKSIQNRKYQEKTFKVGFLMFGLVVFYGLDFLVTTLQLSQVSVSDLDIFQYTNALLVLVPMRYKGNNKGYLQNLCP